MNHSQWKTRRSRKLLGETVEESPTYVEAGYAFALGQAVYNRRTALGLSQTELARRAGMTQPQISTIEGGDSVPTLPLLTRLAKALDASEHRPRRRHFEIRLHRPQQRSTKRDCTAQASIRSLTNGTDQVKCSVLQLPRLPEFPMCQRIWRRFAEPDTINPERDNYI